jgi:hypothetical protein
MRELFGVELATGSLDAIVQRVGEALAEPQARLAEQIRLAAVVNIDETGWRTAGGGARSGALLPGRERSSGSPPAVTSVRPRRCSARTSPASPTPIAGRPTTISTLNSASSARRTWSGTSPPTARAPPRSSSSAKPDSRSQHGYSRPGTPTATTATAPSCSSRSARSKPSSRRCWSRRHARARRASTTVSSPTTCSSAGRRCGPSPSSTPSSRPTITPSAACAAPSSTANSPSAASPSKASARSSGSSPPRSPAACRGARSSPISPTSSPPASEATPSPPSPNLAGHLNAYRKSPVSGAFRVAGAGFGRTSTTAFRLVEIHPLG